MEASKNVRHVQLSPPPACPTSSRLANTTFVAEGRGPGPPTSEDRSAATGLPCGVRRLVVWGLGLLAFSGLVMLWTSGSSERQSQQQQGKRKPSPSASPSSCPSARRAYSSKSTNTDGTTIPSPPSSSGQRDPLDAAAAVSPPSLTSSILACSSPKPPPPDATTVKDLPPPLMQLALVDQSLESIDRSGPLSLYTSLVAAPSPASELAIRRSVSWSEPYLSSDEHSDDDLLCSPTTITTNIVHRLDCSDRKPSLREIAASDMPIFHTCCETVDSDASSAPSSTISNGKLAGSAAEKLKTDSHAADDHEQSYTTVTSQRCHGVNWTQVKIDLFLLICILSFLLYFFYFRSRQPARPKEIQIPKETVPFLLYRLLP